VEIDFRLGEICWRAEEGLEFLPDHSQDIVMLENFINLINTSLDFFLREDQMTLRDERAAHTERSS
jgi:hypothetical protein